MEVLFEIDETDGLELEKIISNRRITLSEALKEAVGDYIQKHEISNIGHDVFGTLKKPGKTGADMQQYLRKGWSSTS